MAKGKKTGGRRKGTPNHSSQYVAEVLDRLNCEPIEGMALIAMRQVPCLACDGKGRVAGKRSPTGRACKACNATGRERVPIALAAKMLSDLASYRYPRLKAVEHRASDQQGNTVSLVELLSLYRQATTADK